MLVRISHIIGRWRAGELSDPACAALYFLCWQIHLHGKRFAARRSRVDRRPDVEACVAVMDRTDGPGLDLALAAWFETYQFKDTIPAVARALAAWLRRRWDLLLLTRIPSPDEVLTMQVEGRRPVTLVTDAERMLRPVLTKSDGFHFLIHDLEHASKFFADADLHVAQRELFRRLRSQVDAGLFRTFREDAVFAQKFDYLISDMNTHRMHSLLYLRAILVESALRREGKAADALVSAPAWAEVNRILQAVAPDVALPPGRR